METDRATEMLKYVEDYYQESRLYKIQNSAKGKELDIIHAILNDLPNQFHPQTATWSLKLWEEFVGIAGGSGTIAERRAGVMMKLLTLQRITPISLERLIKNVAKANVDIIRNIAPYTFKVIIQSNSFNSDFRLIKKIVEEYKEAHMAFLMECIKQDALKVSILYFNRLVIESEFYPRLNIPYLQYNGAAKHDGIYKYNGYMTDKRIDFYPTGLNIYGDVKPIVLFEPRIIFKDKAEKEQVGYREKLCISEESDSKSTYQGLVGLKTGFLISPQFFVTMTIYKHIKKYNGMYKYDGSMKYDAKIIKEEL